ncbi:MAG: hypothetical protein Q9171_006655 [Xanthocarpia ochracea]
MTLPPRGLLFALDTPESSHTPAESVFRRDQTVQEATWEEPAEEPESSNTYSAYIPACLRQKTKVDVWGDEASEQDDSEGRRGQAVATVAISEAEREDSNEPLTSSRVGKLASSLKGFVRKHSPRRQRTNSYQEWTLAGDSWQTPADNWSLEGIHVEVNLNEADEAVSQLANFTEPLAESSDGEAEDFLSRFLSTRREVDIHGDRKHKLAMFLAKVCEEASFAFVLRHDPGMLPLLQISTPDQVEFEVWVTLVGHVRRRNWALNDGSHWPNPDTWGAGETPRETDNITRLRHVVPFIDGTTTDEVGCTPGIEMPIGTTAYQQLLGSCQHILERSLFNFARQKFPSKLLSCGRTCASQIDLNQYSSVFHHEMRKALPDIPQAQVSDLLYAARMFRNASPHHHEFDLDIPITRTVAARSDACWLSAPEHNAAPLEAPVNVNRDRFSNAEAVALMVGDEEAATKIRSLVHIADINSRTTVQKAKMQEAQRSVVDWEGLERVSAGQKSA